MINEITELDNNEKLSKLMLEHHVTLGDMYFCATLNMSKIKNMINIFKLESSRDQQLVLKLLSLLAKNQDKRIVNCYREEYGMPIIDINLPKEDIELLLTACLYNSSFFDYALDVCERREAMLPVRESIIDILVKLASKALNKVDEITNEIIEVISSPNRIYAPSLAAPQSEGFKEYKIDFPDISDIIYLKWNKQKQVYLEIIFDEPKNSISPFELTFCFTTTSDKKSHTIKIPFDKKPIKDIETGLFTLIRSGKEEGIDCSEGLEPNHEIKLKIKAD